MRGEERKWAAPQSIVYLEKLQQSSCVFGYLYRHISTAQTPSGRLSSDQRTEWKGDCGAFGPRSRLLRLGRIRPAWLPGPFTETVLGLIIPSCASSPSPAGLRVPASSAKTPQSLRSQGETERKAHARRPQRLSPDSPGSWCPVLFSTSLRLDCLSLIVLHCLPSACCMRGGGGGGEYKLIGT